MSRKHNHYFKDVTHLKTIDVYRVLALFEVTDPCLQHAVKKLLVAGGRGAKDQRKDIQEAVDTLQRRLEIEDEDAVADKDGWLVHSGGAMPIDGSTMVTIRTRGDGVTTAFARNFVWLWSDCRFFTGQIVAYAVRS